MQAGCRRFDSVWLHHIFSVLSPFGLLEHIERKTIKRRVAALVEWVISQSYEFASGRMTRSIDIVKEEFDRPLIGFQVRFEEDIVWQVKPGSRPASTSFRVPEPS